MLNWAKQFGILVFLDNNGYSNTAGHYECMVAVGGANELSPDSYCDSLKGLQALHDANKDWLFGHISYDYKNELEPGLNSRHSSKSGFPLMHFFVPFTVCYMVRGQTTLVIETFGDPDAVFAQLLGFGVSRLPASLPKLNFKSVTDKTTYLDTVCRLRAHIKEGDCYEINYCNERYCAGVAIDPAAVFTALNELSPAPFAAYYRFRNNYLMCASPERYLSKTGDILLAQPIKGTARRGEDAEADAQMKIALQHDQKERAENVMIVDLIRNDLARSCVVGSVAVDELFGIYTFPQVHQMISTISGKLRPDCSLTDAIKHSFPMGSMTGAPKYKVMQLTEQYERSAREVYSGTVGYITPAGDFDFNVVIRSLVYNADTQYLCYQTGGAITYDSIPENEWEETRLKAWAMERLFQ